MGVWSGTRAISWTRPGRARTPAVPEDPGARLRRRLHGGEGLSPRGPAGDGAYIRVLFQYQARRRPESPSILIRRRMQPMAVGAVLRRSEADDAEMPCGRLRKPLRFACRRDSQGLAEFEA